MSSIAKSQSNLGHEIRSYTSLSDWTKTSYAILYFENMCSSTCSLCRSTKGGVRQREGRRPSHLLFPLSDWTMTSPCCILKISAPQYLIHTEVKEKELNGLNMLIRRYQPQDKETVRALHFAWLEQLGAKVVLIEPPPYDTDLDNIESIYLDNGGEFIVGVLDNEIVAMGAYRRLSPLRAEIKRIRVRLDCRGRGYGESILKNLLLLAGKAGYSEICLDTTADNNPAQQLFAKHGFIENHRGKLDSLDIIYYEKKLE
jgi:ribosomal protein S18 acetylase RimI-like enzyme